MILTSLAQSWQTLFGYLSCEMQKCTVAEFFLGYPVTLTQNCIASEYRSNDRWTSRLANNNYFNYAKFRANQENGPKNAEVTIPGIGSASAKKRLGVHRKQFNLKRRPVGSRPAMLDFDTLKNAPYGAA